MSRSTERKPRALAVVNGSLRLPLLELDVEQNSFFESDTFDIKMPSTWFKAPYDLDWLSQQESLDIALYIGFPADTFKYSESDLTPLLKGRADNIDIQWDQTTVSLSGRDLTGVLIDAQITDTLLNQSVAKAVAAIAATYGFKISIKSAASTSQTVGSYLSNDWTKLAKHSAWDLLTQLANDMPTTDGTPWVCFVDWDTLYFGPRPSDSTFDAIWGTKDSPGNLEQLSTKRNLLVSKDITVTVKGWNLQTGTTVVEQATTSGHASKGANYVYVMNNLTPAEAKAKAAAKLAQLAHHEIVAVFTMPGDPALNMKSKVRLSNTGTETFDTELFPYSISHRYAVTLGYSMDCTAKNHAPQTVIR